MSDRLTHVKGMIKKIEALSKELYVEFDKPINAPFGFGFEVRSRADIMAREAKYVKFDGTHGEYIVLFPNWITHNEFAQQIRDRPISAGFARTTAEGKVTCYGESISLRLQSEESDSKIASRMMGYEEL